MELSIVIPTFNRSAFLELTLKSIVEQQIETRSFEVIVIDNGSTDATEIVCKKFRTLIKNFIYHYDDEPGQLTGRHKGTELSCAGIISFIDDDVELNPKWIDSIIAVFDANLSVSIVGGPCLPKYQQYPPSWVKNFWEPTPYGGVMCLPLSLIDIGAESLEIDPLYVFGLNYSIRKDVLLKLGGFHPDCIPKDLQKFQGDGETGLSLKAKSSNIKALYTSAAFLYHQVAADRLTSAYFEKWYYYNGVCQSFTDIRSAFKLNGTKPDATFNIQKRLYQKVSKVNEIVKRAVRRKDVNVSPEIVRMQSIFSIRYKEGYQFHQHHFKTDSRVRDWVLKDDYWNYKIPG
ncbi:MAG: glycosyltransferase family 2 protein [Chitinophagaceae bacterium]